MRRWLRMMGHGVGVTGAALGIETAAAAVLPSLPRFFPFAVQVIQPRTGTVLSAALVLIGMMLVAMSP
ncbi:MAG TPA: hypothetical protein VMU87_02350 [Stellaceae bacterium]|nr:hypothetical protein [Stellaceae bacterium]